MGIKISHDECVFFMGAEQQVQVCAIAWWAAGFGGNVYVDDVQLDIISYDCQTLVFDDRVARENMVCG